MVKQTKPGGSAPPQTAALAPRDGAAVAPSLTRYEPTTIAEGLRLAELVVTSGLAPFAIKNASQAFMVMATGAELGLSAMQSLRNIHIVKGRTVLAADIMVGLCQSRPECLYFRRVEADETHAIYETQRRGNPDPKRAEFTVKDAEAAGLIPGKPDSAWRKYRRAMLAARAKAELARDVYPDLLAGLYTEDEISPGHSGSEGVPVAGFMPPDDLAPRQVPAVKPAAPAPPTIEAEVVKPSKPRDDPDAWMDDGVQEPDAAPSPIRSPEWGPFQDPRDTGEPPAVAKAPTPIEDLEPVNLEAHIVEKGTDPEPLPAVAVISKRDLEHLFALMLTSAFEAEVSRDDACAVMHRYISATFGVPNARHLPVKDLKAAQDFASSVDNFRPKVIESPD